jgi:acetyl-CoA C-acetyltransferase
MPEIIIAGIGQIPVGEHWELSLRSQAAKAILAARKDAGGLLPQSIYIGNFLASTVSHQSNLGALISEWSGLVGAEGIAVEAAGASGAAAFHMAYLAVASGFVDVAAAVGVEKVTDLVGPGLEQAIAESLDADYEAAQGITPTSQAAMMMRRYLYETKAPREAFGEFPILAHANAVANPNAMFRKAISRKTYDQAAIIADPLNLMDMAPYADGAAAVILTRSDRLPADFPHPLVRVTGSAVSSDTLALHDRPDPLAFDAARIATQRACRQAGILPSDADFFELCDSFSIYGVLALEAAGLAPRGEGWKLALDGSLKMDGRMPILTMGGQKARGNPLAAAGMYQLIEATQQLRGTAGANQLAHPRRALVQSLGGPASSAVTHVLERWEMPG